MTEDLAISRLESASEAFSARDMSALLDSWSPDIVWKVGGKTTLRGRSELEGWFNGLWEKTGGTIRTDMEKVLATGKYAVHFIRLSGEYDGESFSTLAAAFTEAGPDGRPHRLWFIPDDAAVLRRVLA
jgi:ketosteroid isomerase-like protein